MITLSFSSTTTHCISSNTHDSSLYFKLHSCKSIKELKQTHSAIIKTNPPFETQQVVYTKIISLCASIKNFTELSYVYTLFFQLHNPDIFVYNDVIKLSSSSTNKKDYVIALVLYRRLVKNGLVGNNYTYPFVLKACAQLLALKEGQMVHANVIKRGFFLDLYVVNTLMRFYGVCGGVGDVRKVFERSPQLDLVSWTVLIQGFVDNGLYLEGIDFFFNMLSAGVKLDEKVMVVVLSACAKIGDLSLGKKLHEHICNCGMKFDVFVRNALIDMYLKCGDSASARMVFNQMPVKNVVSWNTLISGLVQSGEYKEALSVFRNMRMQRLEPDEFTLVSILSACANIGVLELGKWVHVYIDKKQILTEGYLGNALIDMYAKCGRIDSALKVFEGIKSKDVYTYSTIIMGLAINGRGELALKLFCEMYEKGIEPVSVTFVCVLTACSHAGLVEEGQKHFADMSRKYNFGPQTEHYGCMVDLLGRAGLISQAYEFVKKMPIEPDKLIWVSLLGACRIHGNVELAERVMKKLVKVEPEKDGAYVLLSNIYASEKKWNNMRLLRKGMKEEKIKKSPGCSSIELDGVVYEFKKGDKAHSRAKEIYGVLNAMVYHLYDCEHIIDDNEFFY